MKKTNYYAKVNYRGREKDYRVVAEEGNDIRIKYLDYNPEREWDDVWIKNGKDRIIKVYSENDEAFKYYRALEQEWDKNIKELMEHYNRVFNVEHCLLGTDHYKQAYRKAVKTLNSVEEI